MATKTVDANFTGLFDQAMENFSEAFKAGVKMQEDIANWWSETLDQAGPAQEWQRRSRAILSDAMPAAQKNAEEWLKVVEENNFRSMELLKKAFSGDSVSTPGEFQEKLKDFWEESLEVLKENTQAMAQANAKVMDLWAEVLRKNMTAAVKSASAAAQTAKA
jgi:hypothetical protein